MSSVEGTEAAQPATRVDRWLWAVRVFKTRNAAQQACKAGHVRVDEARAKPAPPVRPGEVVEVRGQQGRVRVLEVVEPIDKRVSATVAAQCLIDRSPPPPPKEERATPPRRDPGAGRPTKRERRQLEQVRGAKRHWRR